MDDDRRVRFVRLCRRQRVAIWRPLRYRLFKCISKSAMGKSDTRTWSAIIAPVRYVDRAITGRSSDKAHQPFRSKSDTVAGGFGPALLGIGGILKRGVSRVVGVSIPTASRVLLGFVSAVVVVVRNNQTITLAWSCDRQRRRRSVGPNEAFMHWTLSIHRQCLSNICKNTQWSAQE